MDAFYERIAAIGVVPVVALEDAEDALPLAEALREGGLPCAEVTFRTDAAEESLRRMAEGAPELLVGAGTVLTREQADRAIDAGARFLVSPGLNPQVVRFAQDAGVPMIPGVCTPTEIETALGLGLDVVKFFPAEPSGGLPMLRALAAPYRGLRFLPTGGIGPQNLRDYLAFPPILACGGSWMVRPELIRAGRFDEVRRLAAEAAALVREARRGFTEKV